MLGMRQMTRLRDAGRLGAISTKQSKSDVARLRLTKYSRSTFFSVRLLRGQNCLNSVISAERHGHVLKLQLSYYLDC